MTEDGRVYQMRKKNHKTRAVSQQRGGGEGRSSVISIKNTTEEKASLQRGRSETIQVSRKGEGQALAAENL